ncbi:hypothetical protein KKF38_01580 [Patescibacteria group bacterium]|nr:hypothetical protein [Patescibacteria group bacterium]
MIFNQLSKLIHQLGDIVQKLEKMFPKRKFTLDGHLVGSLGEVWAREEYKFELLPSGTEKHDAKKDNQLIQIKTTQTNRIALSSCPDHLLVLHLDLKNPKLFEEIYYGNGEAVWEKCGNKQNPPKNGQYSISFNKIREIQKLNIE